MQHPEGLLLLDACSLINLCATGHLREVLEAQQLPVGVVDAGRAESQYLLRGGDGEDADERDPIDLGPVIGAGVLLVLALGGDREYVLAVDYAAAGLDDGEARMLAVAQARGFEVATDDRKACRIIRESGVGFVRHSTADILRRWADRCQLAPGVLAEAIRAVQQRARYHSRAGDAEEWTWWQTALNGG